jgi:hypothetical protein
MPAKKTKPEPEPEEQPGWSPERCRRLRMAYDKEIRSGTHPKDTEKSFDFEGEQHGVGFTYYLLEYLETCVFWPPQSRVYNLQPELEE